MFDLDSAVNGWRNDLAREGALSNRDLDELEDHLHSSYESLVESGCEADFAFEQACQDVGAVAELADEFGKIEEKTWRQVIVGGLALYVVSFFLPVYRFGIKLFGDGVDDIPGFEAFFYAISGELGFLGIVSALTNFLMVAALLKLSRFDRTTILSLAGVVIAAAFLNLWWMTEGFADLLIGYYAWWASFASVATGLVLRARDLGGRAVPEVAA
ncbi:MAG: hypothetical protein HKN13_13105 [Rhodothermales bacterium]|nr:hypothetical protein [Rhodothermales bacterium]